MNTVVRPKTHRLYSERDVSFEILVLANVWAGLMEDTHKQITMRMFDDLWLFLDGRKLKSGAILDVPKETSPAMRFIIRDIKARA